MFTSHYDKIRKVSHNLGFSEKRFVLFGLWLLFGLYTTALTDDLFPGGDNAHYLVLADALQSGQGYRTISLVDNPQATQRPPGFSMLLVPVLWIFGMNIVVAKLFVGMWGVLSVALVFAYFKRDGSLQAAIIIAILFATAPVVLMYSRRVYSTMSFVTLLFVILILAKRIVYGKNHLKTITLITALLCVMVFYVRTIGLALCLAVIIWLFIRKRWFTVGILTLLIFPTIALWFYWTSQVEGVLTAGYLKQFFSKGESRETIQLIFSNMYDYSRLLTENLYYTVTKAPDQIGLHWKVLNYLENIIIAVSLLILIVGFLDQWEYTIGLEELYLGIYVGVLLLWPHTIDRFIIPILPFVMKYYWYGVCRLWKEILVRLRDVFYGVRWLHYGMVIFILLSNGIHLVARIYQEQNFSTFAPRMAAFYDVATWANSNLPPSAIVLTDKSNFFYIYASRQTVDINSYTHIEDLVYDQRMNYVVIDDMTAEESLSVFKFDLAQLDELYCADIEKNCIYEISRN